ncbi:Protein N-acetyltransferase, RimJ/RimL family [Thalassospira xiamenensis M-5 = DSM 17429]|uniref:Ribosomal-protein-alanine acetyltransferase n=1 Tax=Thalassospira xiamenensis M-5 = DSM 17429 TaxID=1123366 RepID=A0AB72UDN1_9PROT|nr:GNAT family N-acetyltransferase [Thalassospira xiamenensis]AJD52302.1 ribosomal-protein-alanine acetyltransferase [Thalassospira xiamenensis M-5 = DSM 17429]SIS87503.1 Protein N-acetyltransferase, RimJ/RimL family [Thalassospira xiamenensis M-5 = DSM 17429]
MTILETKRTLVRHATHDDAPFIMQLLNEPGWIRFVGDRNIHDLDAARKFIDDRLLSSYLKHGFGLYIVDEKATHTAIGLCGFVKRDTLDAPDIGYAITESRQGMGYAFEVSNALIDYGYDVLGFERIFGYTLPDNTVSLKLLTKLGLTYERDQDVNNSGETCKLFVKVA